MAGALGMILAIGGHPAQRERFDWSYILIGVAVGVA